MKTQSFSNVDSGLFRIFCKEVFQLYPFFIVGKTKDSEPVENPLSKGQSGSNHFGWLVPDSIQICRKYHDARIFGAIGLLLCGGKHNIQIIKEL